MAKDYGKQLAWNALEYLCSDNTGLERVSKCIGELSVGRRDGGAGNDFSKSYYKKILEMNDRIRNLDFDSVDKKIEYNLLKDAFNLCEEIIQR
jgi:hypothetical protein